MNIRKTEKKTDRNDRDERASGYEFERVTETMTASGRARGGEHVTRLERFCGRENVINVVGQRCQYGTYE